MTDGILLVLSQPVAGMEDEFHDWYDNQHLADVLSLPGFVAAQRFEYVGSTREDAEAPGYLAIYEIEGDLERARSVLDEARSDPRRLRPSAALDRERTVAHYFRPRTQRETAPDVG